MRAYQGSLKNSGSSMRMMFSQGVAVFDLADVLDDVQLLAVDHSHLIDPGQIVQPDGVDHQRVPFPVSDRISHEGGT